MCMKSPGLFHLAVSALALALALVAPAAEGELHEADLVVYGDTSAAVVAAVQAARLGLSAVVVAPQDHLGGLSSNGLGWTDTGNTSVIGGVSREFYERVHRRYRDPEAWPLQEPAELNADRGSGRFNPEGEVMWVFEPKVAEAVFEEMLAEVADQVAVHRERRLDRGEGGVLVEDGRLVEIRSECGRRFRGAVFVDATYEGDLLAAAGVSYRTGRESNEEHGETLNGVQKTMMRGHLFTQPVDPYRVPGDPSSGLVLGIHGDPPGEDGEGDHRIQAYNFRMCMSEDPRNRVPFPKPEDYDEGLYELLFRNFEAGDLRLPFSPGRIPNRKTDTNNFGAVSTNMIGANYAYPEGSYEEREAIVAKQRSYQQGLMWTLANHPRVPEVVREAMEPWGLAADEFVENGHWPRQIYVREARRMESAYVVTELDCRRVRVAEDSVGLGSYNMDSHNVQRYVTDEGHAQNEGDVQVSPGGPYVVPYRAIVPREEECTNLFVPVCVSSSHIAFGSIRMEPVFMILAHTAATAAAMAIEAGVPVQQVPYEALRERLLAEGQILDLPPGAAPREFTRASSLPGIVVDDNQAEYEGEWTTSTSAAAFVETGYRHDGYGRYLVPQVKTARFVGELPAAGRYEVRLAYPPNPNRSRSVPVTVSMRDGEHHEILDQRKGGGDELGFVSLGTHEFDAGPASVTVSNEGADGYVVIDAVQWLPKE